MALEQCFDVRRCAALMRSLRCFRLPTIVSLLFFLLLVLSCCPTEGALVLKGFTIPAGQSLNITWALGRSAPTPSDFVISAFPVVPVVITNATRVEVESIMIGVGATLVLRVDTVYVGLPAAVAGVANVSLLLRDVALQDLAVVELRGLNETWTVDPAAAIMLPPLLFSAANMSLVGAAIFSIVDGRFPAPSTTLTVTNVSVLSQSVLIPSPDTILPLAQFSPFVVGDLVLSNSSFLVFESVHVEIHDMATTSPTSSLTASAFMFRGTNTTLVDSSGIELRNLNLLVSVRAAGSNTAQGISFQAPISCLRRGSILLTQSNVTAFSPSSVANSIYATLDGAAPLLLWDHSALAVTNTILLAIGKTTSNLYLSSATYVASVRNESSLVVDACTLMSRGTQSSANIMMFSFGDSSTWVFDDRSHLRMLQSNFSATGLESAGAANSYNVYWISAIHASNESTVEIAGCRMLSEAPVTLASVPATNLVFSSVYLSESAQFELVDWTANATGWGPKNLDVQRLVDLKGASNWIVHRATATAFGCTVCGGAGAFVYNFGLKDLATISADTNSALRFELVDFTARGDGVANLLFGTEEFVLLGASSLVITSCTLLVSNASSRAHSVWFPTTNMRDASNVVLAFTDMTVTSNDPNLGEFSAANLGWGAVLIRLLNASSISVKQATMLLQVSVGGSNVLLSDSTLMLSVASVWSFTTVNMTVTGLSTSTSARCFYLADSGAAISKLSLTNDSTMSFVDLNATIEGGLDLIAILISPYVAEIDGASTFSVNRSTLSVLADCFLQTVQVVALRWQSNSVRVSQLSTVSFYFVHAAVATSADPSLECDSGSIVEGLSILTTNYLQIVDGSTFAICNSTLTVTNTTADTIRLVLWLGPVIVRRRSMLLWEGLIVTGSETVASVYKVVTTLALDQGPWIVDDESQWVVSRCLFQGTSNMNVYSWSMSVSLTVSNGSTVSVVNSTLSSSSLERNLDVVNIDIAGYNISVVNASTFQFVDTSFFAASPGVLTVNARFEVSTLAVDRASSFVFSRASMFSSSDGAGGNIQWIDSTVSVSDASALTMVDCDLTVVALETNAEVRFSNVLVQDAVVAVRGVNSMVTISRSIFFASQACNWILKRLPWSVEDGARVELNNGTRMISTAVNATTQLYNLYASYLTLTIGRVSAAQWNWNDVSLSVTGLAGTGTNMYLDAASTVVVQSSSSMKFVHCNLTVSVLPDTATITNGGTPMTNPTDQANIWLDCRLVIVGTVSSFALVNSSLNVTVARVKVNAFVTNIVWNAVTVGGTGASVQFHHVSLDIYIRNTSSLPLYSPLFANVMILVELQVSGFAATLAVRMCEFRLQSHELSHSAQPYVANALFGSGCLVSVDREASVSFSASQMNASADELTVANVLHLANGSVVLMDLSRWTARDNTWIAIASGSAGLRSTTTGDSYPTGNWVVAGLAQLRVAVGSALEFHNTALFAQGPGSTMNIAVTRGTMPSPSVHLVNSSVLQIAQCTLRATSNGAMNVGNVRIDVDTIIESDAKLLVVQSELLCETEGVVSCACLRIGGAVLHIANGGQLLVNQSNLTSSTTNATLDVLSLDVAQMVIENSSAFIIDSSSLNASLSSDDVTSEVGTIVRLSRSVTARNGSIILFRALDVVLRHAAFLRGTESVLLSLWSAFSVKACRFATQGPFTGSLVQLVGLWRVASQSALRFDDSVWTQTLSGNPPPAFSAAPTLLALINVSTLANTTVPTRVLLSDMSVLSVSRWTVHPPVLHGGSRFFLLLLWVDRRSQFASVCGTGNCTIDFVCNFFNETPLERPFAENTIGVTFDAKLAAKRIRCLAGHRGQTVSTSLRSTRSVALTATVDLVVTLSSGASVSVAPTPSHHSVSLSQSGSLDLPPPPEPPPQAPVSAQVIGVATSAISPLMVMYAQRALLVVRIAKCDLSVSDSPDFASSPTLWALGDDALRFRRGTIVGDAILCVAFGVLLTIVAAVKAHVSPSPTHRNEQPGLVHEMCSLGAEGRVLAVASMFVQPVMTAALCVLMWDNHAAAADIVLAVVGLGVFAVGTPAFVARLLVFRFHATGVERAFQLRRRRTATWYLFRVIQGRTFTLWRSAAKPVHPLKRRDTGRWPLSLAPNFCDRFNVMFDTLLPNRATFPVLVVCLSVVAGVVESVATMYDDSVCEGMHWVQLALNVAFLAVIAHQRPCNSRLEMCLMVVSAVLTALSSALALNPSCASCLDAGFVLVAISIYLGFLGAAVVAALHIWTNRKWLEKVARFPRLLSLDGGHRHWSASAGDDVEVAQRAELSILSDTEELAEEMQERRAARVVAVQEVRRAQKAMRDKRAVAMNLKRLIVLICRQRLDTQLRAISRSGRPSPH